MSITENEASPTDIHAQQAPEKPENWTLLYPIFSSHVKRIGWARTLAGLLPMYTCIPPLIVMHLTSCVIVYQWVLRPLLRTPKVRWADYVIIDRHRIDGLSALDKFNCMFCGYANGLCTMANVELDHVASASSERTWWQKALLVPAIMFMLPMVVLFEISLQVIYNLLVSRPLGMHRISMREAATLLETQGYGNQFSWLSRGVLRQGKSFIFRFTMGLEQIESSWCPLRHFEKRKGVVYPAHHVKFFGPEELEQMRHLLSTTGTVSDRTPTW